MPRQRMSPGEHGKITEREEVFKDKAGKPQTRYLASIYVRDHDGKRRRVARSSDKSAEDARRILQRHLSARRPPIADQLIDDKTTLTQLFEAWLANKVKRGDIKPQTTTRYRALWTAHGAPQLGELRIRELSASHAEAHLQDVAETAPAQAGQLRIILRAMFGAAVRYDVVSVNPITETQTTKAEPVPVRSVSAEEFGRIRTAVAAYASSRDGKGGPKPGRLLGAFVELLAATGARPNEVLALEWESVDLLSDPPTVTISATLIDHGRIEGKALHRQDGRKHNAPAHTIVLPQFGVEALLALVGESGMAGPVFATRDGGWVSLANLRRSLRAALPDDLSWVTPRSFRRTVATEVRNTLGPAAAQQQLSHAKLSTTEQHYLQRHTRGPDVRAVLDKFAGQDADD